MATKLHQNAQGEWVRCRARKRHGQGVTHCILAIHDKESDTWIEPKHVDGYQGVARNGGGIVRRAIGGGDYRFTYIAPTKEDRYISTTGSRTSLYEKDATRIKYGERGGSMALGSELPEGFNISQHGVLLYDRTDNDPLAWSVHTELATIQNMNEAQWQGLPASDRRALINNATNRYFAMIGGSEFKGHTQEITWLGRAHYDANTRTSEVHFAEGFENQPPLVVARSIAKQVANAKRDKNKSFEQDFDQKFKAILNEQGMDENMGTTKTSKDMARAQAFAAKRASRHKWSAKCKNGHETHATRPPKAVMFCIKCDENGDELEPLTFVQKVGR